MGKKPKAPDQRALVVGISNYLHPRWNALAAVAADVREIAAILGSEKGAFPITRISVLTDAEAKRAAILSQLRTTLVRASRDDTVFVYLAGHGAVARGQHYFVPYDCAGDDLERTGIPLSVLRSLFEKCASRKLFLLLDFCYAGGILARGDEPNNPAALARAIAVSGNGKIIIAACTSTQLAYEDPDAGHGFFTHALLRGLRGEAASDDGEVTALSLYEFIVRNIQHAGQRPVFVGQMEGLIVLTRYTNRAAPVARPSSETAGGTTRRRRPAGPMIMLGNNFFRAQSVEQMPNGILALQFKPRNADEEAVLASLRRPRYGLSERLPFAVGNDAYFVRSDEVSSVTSRLGQSWRVAFRIDEEAPSGGFIEAGLNLSGRSYSANDIAGLRARRILLGDAPSRDASGLFSGPSLLESMIDWPNHAITGSIIKSVYEAHGGDAEWKEYARLKAVFLLKSTATVELILQLDIGASRDGSVSVVFRGRRAPQYANTQGADIEVRGECRLSGP